MTKNITFILLCCTLTGCTSICRTGNSRTITEEQVVNLVGSLYGEPKYGDSRDFEINVINDEESDEWVVLVQGKGGFANPGAHTLIRINKQSGAVRRFPGM